MVRSCKTSIVRAESDLLHVNEAFKGPAIGWSYKRIPWKSMGEPCLMTFIGKYEYNRYAHLAPPPKPLCPCQVNCKMDALCCSDSHIAKMSEKIVEWETLAPSFSISPQEEEEIRRNHCRQYRIQKRTMLLKWREKLGPQATYRKLKECFVSAGNQLLANQVDELLHDCTHSGANGRSTGLLLREYRYVLYMYRPLRYNCWP